MQRHEIGSDNDVHQQRKNKYVLQQVISERSYRKDCKTEKIDPLSPQTQGSNKIRTPSQRKREYGTGSRKRNWEYDLVILPSSRLTNTRGGTAEFCKNMEVAARAKQIPRVHRPRGKERRDMATPPMTHYGYFGRKYTKPPVQAGGIFCLG